MFRLFCYWFVGDSRHSTCPRRLLIMVSVEPYFLISSLDCSTLSCLPLLTFSSLIDVLILLVLLQILRQFRLSYNIIVHHIDSVPKTISWQIHSHDVVFDIYYFLLLDFSQIDMLFGSIIYYFCNTKLYQSLSLSITNETIRIILISSSSHFAYSTVERSDWFWQIIFTPNYIWGAYLVDWVNSQVWNS